MKQAVLYRVLTISIAAVWLINGLFCKVMSLVPRHQQIVGEILGERSARTFTVLIGIGEVFIAVWILSGWKARQVSILQMIIIAMMNTLEFFLVPHLLFWGKWNALFAVLFILIIFIHSFYISPKPYPINRHV